MVIVVCRRNDINTIFIKLREVGCAGAGVEGGRDKAREEREKE
jgi:hypothetical protein